MFNIFMSKAMIKKQNSNFQSGVTVNLIFNKDLVHNTLINIIKKLEIIASLIDKQRIKYLIKKK